MEATSLQHKLKSKSGRYTLLLGLLVFSLPLGQPLFTNLFLLLLILGSFIILKKEDWSRGNKDWLAILPMCFFIFLVASLLWTEDVSSGQRYLETKLSFLFLPLFIMAGKNQGEPRQREFILKALWFGCLLASLIALAFATWRSINAGAFYELNSNGDPRFFFAYTHLASPLMHPGYIASYLAMGIFAGFELQRQRGSNSWKWVYRISLLLFFVMMVLLQARINLIALFLVIGLAALFMAWQRKAYVWLVLPLFPLVGLGLFLGLASEDLQKRYFQFPDFSYDISGDSFNSATYRLAEWECAWLVIEENALGGTGVGDKGAALLEAYERKGFWEGLRKKFNAHNQYLETQMAAGIFASFLMLSMLIYYGLRAYRQSDYLALMGVVFLMICLLTESMFERMWGVLFFTVLFPVLLSKPKESVSNAR